MSQVFPIGTVVKLKNATKNMMICGYCPTGPARPGYVFDYTGFPYPEGYMDVDQIYMFDEDQIEDILAMGYQDKAAHEYMMALDDAIDDIKRQTAEQYEQSEEKGEE